MTAKNTPVSAEDALALIRDGAVVLDVRGRRPDEKVEGAVRTDKSRLDELFSDDHPDRIELGDADQSIVVYCGSERGSAGVAEYLTERGYTSVHHVQGGFPALRDAGSDTVPLAPDES